MKSLRLKMTLQFSIVIFMVTSVLTWPTIFAMRSMMKDNAHSDMMEMAQMSADFIGAKVGEDIEFMDGLSSSMTLNELKNLDSTQVAFFRDIVEEKGYMELSYADSEGIAYRIGDHTDSIDISHRQYYKDAIKGQTVSSDILISIREEKPIMVVAAPLWNGNRVEGILFSVIDAAEFIDISTQINYRGKSMALVVNNEGTIVASPDFAQVEEQQNIIEEGASNPVMADIARMVSKAVASDTKGTDTYEIGGQDRVAAFAPVEDHNWTVLLLITNTDLLEEPTRLAWIMFFIGAGALNVGVVVAFIVSTRIVNPIILITNGIKKLGDYDFTVAQEESKDRNRLMAQKDEIGQMSRALVAMRDNIRSLVANAGTTAEQVAAASQELTSTSEELLSSAMEVSTTVEEIANGASSQADNTNQSAALLNELGDIIESEKSNVEVLSGTTVSVISSVQSGRETLSELGDNIDLNNSATTVVQESITKTNERSAEISEASNLISSISDQTNLLALNAAIEAARAGEHGKGFAVVAEEIRKLAEQSTESTKVIDAMVTDLQEDAQKAVRAVEDMVRILEDQKKNMKATDEKFSEMEDAITKAEAAVDEINSNSLKMEDAKDKTLDKVNELSAVAEENAASTEEATATIETQSHSMEEVARSSEDLAHAAQELQSLISKFSL